MEYRDIVIYDICRLNAHNLTSSDNVNSIYYLDTGNIVKNKINKLQFLCKDKDKFPSRAKRKIQKNTIIYSTVRPIQEHYGFIENTYNNKIIVSTGFTTIDCIDQNVDPKFLYYYLTQPSIIKYFQGIAENSVSSYPAMKPEDIGNLMIKIPKDINIQKTISNFLTILDKKIELNNTINQKLEEMAKLLYDYWFVQFDFPDANGKPYKSSGGKMVYNKELKREIPEGWEVQNLKDNKLAKIIKPSISSFDGEKTYLATADVKDNDINFQADTITYTNRPSRANMQPIANSIWFAKMKNSKKVLYIGDYSQEFIDNFILSTGFMGLKVKNNALEYLWGFINNEHFEMIKDMLANGATQEAINNDDLSFINVLIPTENILNLYHSKTSDIYKKIYINQVENQKLSQLRDWLLPMLMNGQIKVADAANIVQDTLMAAEPGVEYGSKN